jgi:hypothetical protein
LGVLDLFKNIWIINALGLCIYHRNFSGEESVDEQLMSGLLVALRQYSEEALKLSLYTLGGKERKLVITYGTKSKVLGAVECDQEDSPDLVERIIRRLIKWIPEEYLTGEIAKPFSSEGFERMIEEEIFGRQKKIDTIRDLVALTLVLIVAVFYSIDSFLDYLKWLEDTDREIQAFFVQLIPVLIAGPIIGYISMKANVITMGGILEIMALNIVLFDQVKWAWFAAIFLGIMLALSGYAVLWFVKGRKLFLKQETFLDKILSKKSL